MNLSSSWEGVTYIDLYSSILTIDRVKWEEEIFL